MKRAPLLLPLGLLLSAGILLAGGGVYRGTKHGSPTGGVFRIPDVPRGECGQCHDEHASRLGFPTGGPYGYLLFARDDNALCATCHSTSGAFGTYAGSSAYGQSAHALSGGMVWPGPVPPARPYADAGKCVNCHDPHGNRDASGPIPAMSLAREEGLCDPCHDGSPAFKDIRAQFQKSYRHPAYTISGRHAEGEGSASAFASPSARHSECEDCHNPHAAAGDLAPPEAPAASNRLLGVSRVRVLNGPAGMAPGFTFLGPGDPTPLLEFEVCFKCHSSWTAQPLGQSDLAALLNPNNASYHPVEATGRNPNIASGAFVSGWSWSGLTLCTDCHSSDDTAVRGAHGSANPAILRKPYTVSTAQRPGGMPYPSNELCFDCHSYDAYANDAAAAAVKGFSRFNPPSFGSGHTFHVGSEGINCFACHETHGSAFLPALMATGRNPGLISYVQTSTGGTCSPAGACHGSKTYTLNYPR